jgi:hypothetical protein
LGSDAQHHKQQTTNNKQQTTNNKQQTTKAEQCQLKPQSHLFNFRFNRKHGHVGHSCPTYPFNQIWFMVLEIFLEPV